MQREIEEMRRQEDLWVECMARETGQPQKTFIELNERGHEVYITPERCIELGIADRILYDVNMPTSPPDVASPRKTQRRKETRKRGKRS